MIPTLRTERLTLRAPLLDDFEDYAAMLTSPRARFLHDGLTRDIAWGWFSSDVAHWHLFGFGALTIEAEGRAVGQVAVTKGIAFPEPELGWLLYEGAEGQGFATEAAAAMRDYARDEIGVPTLVSYIDPDNTASEGVARRLGAVPDPAADAPKPTEQVWRYEVAA